VVAVRADLIMANLAHPSQGGLIDLRGVGLIGDQAQQVVIGRGPTVGWDAKPGLIGVEAHRLASAGHASFSSGSAWFKRLSAHSSRSWSMVEPRRAIRTSVRTFGTSMPARTLIWPLRSYL
jgi:hypothetical protein